MSTREKFQALNQIYADFDDRSRPFKENAVCRRGCAFCCTHMGSVDVVTLEALAIREHMATLPKPLRRRLDQRISQDQRHKGKKALTPCPFLNKNDTCAVYTVRPFSCRQLYSLAPCAGKGATIHRQVNSFAQASVAALKQLDDTGYAGHLSYILQLFKNDSFTSTYLCGGFDPASIAEFARHHHIRINRMDRRQQP
jgi:hypothetical protein